MKARNPPRWYVLLGASGVAVWILAPLGIAWLLSAQAQDLQITPERPVWVRVEQNTEGSERQVSLSVNWSDKAQLVAPQWSGILQATTLVPGSTVSSGDVVATVDGVDRLALHTSRPFYRPLDLESSGPDVEELNVYLRSQGWPAGDGQSFTRSSLTGVRQLAARLGMRESSEIGAFDPAWVVYLPRPSAVLSTVDLQIAAPVPGVGGQLAELRPVVNSAKLVERALAHTDPADPADPALLTPSAASSAEARHHRAPAVR